MKTELFSLVRELAARAALSDESDWPCAAPSGAQPSVSPPDPSLLLAAISAEVASCRLCPLGATRIKAVPGVGSPRARVLFIGEGPGFEEDRRGEPFVGRAGRLLDKIIGSIGLSRETVFIANMVKCHPMKDPGTPDARGNDRAPAPEELAACRPFIERQIRALRPAAIVALGGIAAKALLGTDEGISRLRGTWAAIRLAGSPELEIPVLPTYHPAFLLRDETRKRDVWNDMKALRSFLAGSPEKGKMTA